MTVLRHEFRNIALRLQQLAEQGGSPNTRLQFTVVCERGIPRYARIRRDVIEPKSATVDWLLELSGESSQDGLIVKVD
jgi:hypothetical protein